MSEHPSGDFIVPLDDEEGDRLLQKADALIHRHESFAIPPEVDDLPVLTEVVDERIEPYIGDAPLLELPAMNEDPEPGAQAGAMAGDLSLLDDALRHHLDEWVDNELPQLISRELDALADRLALAAANHLRATLLPLLSAEIRRAESPRQDD